MSRNGHLVHDGFAVSNDEPVFVKPFRSWFFRRQIGQLLKPDVLSVSERSLAHVTNGLDVTGKTNSEENSACKEVLHNQDYTLSQARVELLSA